MKLNKKDSNSSPEEPARRGEEFFQLPRAEFLADELEENNARQLGDRVTNPSIHLNDRFTLPVEDDSMAGAGIRKDDFVVVEALPGYPEGAVLAVKLGSKQLIRRYTRVKGRIQLQCDPAAKQVIIVEEHTPDFSILGKVIQIIREVK